MATMVGSRGEAERSRGRALSTSGDSSKGCLRCGGLMVGEFCTDLLSSTGELEFLASRCVQCGEVVDPVILQNRKRQKEIMNGRTVRVSARAIESQVAA